MLQMQQLLHLTLVAAAAHTTAAGSCNLSGEWRATKDDRDTYLFQQTGNNVTVIDLPAAGAAATQHWQKCAGSITGGGLVTLKTDTGHTLVATVAANCSGLPWATGPAWCRLGSADCAVPAPGPPHPSPALPVNPSITKVHVVAMNHLDVGFSCRGCGGSNSKTIASLPAPFTWALLDYYFNVAFPMAINTSQSLETGGNASYVYTTHCWLVSYFLDCPSHFGGLSCPSKELVAAFRDAVGKGWITWHAFPHNGEPETFDAELFGDGVDVCHALDDEFSKPHTKVLSQRDVPGLTRAVIPILAQVRKTPSWPRSWANSSLL
jgi:hypothetical protein